jgi:hypothetical protein
MRVTNIHPTPAGNGRFRNVATFDAEVADGLCVHGLTLALAPDGKRFVFSPGKDGRRFCTFRGDYAKQLADAAWQANNGGRVADDKR